MKTELILTSRIRYNITGIYHIWLLAARENTITGYRKKYITHKKTSDKLNDGENQGDNRIA